MSLRALSHQLDNLQEQIRSRIEDVCRTLLLSNLPLVQPILLLRFNTTSIFFSGSLNAAGLSESHVHSLGSVGVRLVDDEECLLTLSQLEEQMQLSIQNSYDRAGAVIRDADAEIARARSILASVDELENELAKIGHIREIVKSFRARIEGLDHRLDQSSTPSSRRRH